MNSNGIPIENNSNVYWLPIESLRKVWTGAVSYHIYIMRLHLLKVFWVYQLPTNWILFYYKLNANSLTLECLRKVWTCTFSYDIYTETANLMLIESLRKVWTGLASWDSTCSKFTVLIDYQFNTNLLQIEC